MKEFDPIIGYTEIKNELSQIADMMRNTEMYEKLGVRLPYGLMLHGSPGVGKTLMANCLIKASGRNVFICRKDKPNGEFIKVITNIFEEAAANAPAIVFLDDMDKFANTDTEHTYAEEYISVQSCIDQYKGRDVFVLATVNDIRMLPSSLRRVGRFDRVIEVPTPNNKDAEKILAHYLKDKKAVADINTEMLVRLMGGMSCATLETIINEAGVYAGYERADSIGMDHLLKSCLRTMFDTPAGGDYDDDYYYCSGESQREQIAVHEAGHVVVSEVLFPGSVTLAAFNEKEGSYGGITSCFYSDSADMRWQKSRIVTALGGMAAMEHQFGFAGAGSCKDIREASIALRSMIGNEGIAGFGLIGYSYNSSQELKHHQEIANSALLNQYYLKAKEIIAKNPELFSKVTEKLLDDSVITMEDIDILRKTYTIAPVELG